MQNARRVVLPILFIALTYYACAQLGLLLAVPPGYSTPVWPPSGVALAAILILGKLSLPGIFLGSFATNVLTSLSFSDLDSIVLSVGLATIIGIGASLQAYIGYIFISRHISLPNRLENFRDIALLIGLGGPLSCTINPTIGVTALSAAGLVMPGDVGFNWVTWWVGDSIGVMVFTPALVLLCSNEGTQKLRKFVISIGLVSSFALTIIVFLFVRHAEQKKYTYMLQQQSQGLSEILQYRFDKTLDVLNAVDYFFATVPDVDQTQFENFTRRYLASNPFVYTMSFNARVTDAERPAFEKRMQESGLSGFSIKERDADGLLFPAQKRDVYFPVTFSANSKSRPASGFDTYSEGNRRHTLDLAISERSARMTAKTVIVQQEKRPEAFIVYHPIFQDSGGQPKGFAAGIFLISEIMGEVSQAANQSHLALQLVDDNEPQEQKSLFSHGMENIEQLGKEHMMTYPLAVAGRNLSLIVYPTPESLTQFRTWLVWFALVCGFLFTVLLSVLFLLLTGQSQAVQRIVEEKTRELELNTGVLKQAAESRKRLLDQMNLIFNSVPAKIWFKDDKNNIIKLNIAAAQSMGGTVEDFEGKNAKTLFPNLSDQYHEDDLEVIRSGEAKFGIVEQFAPANAEARWVSTDKIPYFDPDLGKNGVLVVSTDITPIKNAKSQLRLLVERLASSNKELERFAYAATHDMQEPLRTLSNFSYLIKDEYEEKLDQTGKKYLDFIQSAAERLRNIVGDLLEYSRFEHEPAQVGKIDTQAEVRQVFESLAVKIDEREAEVTWGDLPTLSGNPHQFIRLIQNLVDNGLKYQTRTSGIKIHIDAVDDGDMWKFSVTDNGIGIASEHIKSIFEPFKRLHSWQQHKGSGIGLAVCQRIVEAHGGKIWVETAPDNGSTFYFTWLKQIISAVTAE